MSTKLTLQQILDAVPALKTLLTEKLDLSTGFKLSDLAEILEAKLTTFNKTCQDLLDKLGVVGEDGAKTFPPEQQAEFQKQYDKLVQQEVKVDFDTINVNELPDIKLSTNELTALKWLIVRN